MTRSDPLPSRTILFLVALLPVLGLGGCVSHQGQVGWLDQGTPPAGHYEIIRSVEGTASTRTLFGYSPETTHDLYDRARRNLVEDLELGNGRALVHRTLDVTTKGFPPSVDSNLLDPLLTLVRVYQSKTIHFSGELVRVTDRTESTS